MAIYFNFNGKKCWRWLGLLHAFTGCWGVIWVTGESVVFAQITPDNTLGNESSQVSPNVNIKGATAEQIDGGARRGSNLFHSFLEFNVGDRQRVYFANPVGVENIFSRVTGSDPSDVLGTLGVNGRANLFLMNPNGVIFGQNASLDVGRSFFVTTASGVQFGNLGEFSATNPQSPAPLLTINPSAFLFNTAKPGEIISRSQATQTGHDTPTDGLQVPNGQTLLVLGGNVTVDGGLLNAWGGRVEIGAVAGQGTVGLNANGSLTVPEGMLRADVVFKNGMLSLPDPLRRADVIRGIPFDGNKRGGIDVRLDGGGDIKITAGNVSILDGSQIRAGIATGLGKTGSQGGAVTVNATGEVRMSGDDSRIANDIQRNATGKAGDIQVTARSLVVLDGAQLSASTFSVGDAGNVIMQADRIVFSGVRTDRRGSSAAFSRVERPNSRQIARGNGGTVQIFTKVLEVTNNAALVTSTNGIGDAGNLVIVASDRVLFDKESIAISNVSPSAVGQGGNIEIATNTLELNNGAQLGAYTLGTGNAGKILINASQAVNITGTSPLGYSSGIFTSTDSESKGGDITINTQAFRLTDGGVLDSRTFADGFSGNIKVNVTTVDILNGGQMLAITEGKGRAGDINVNASESVNVAGIDSTFTQRLAKFPNRVASLNPNSGIFVRSQASGGAGEIAVNAPKLQLNQGILSAESATADGGNINLTIPKIIRLRNGSLISATAGTAQQGGNGGNIDIKTNFIVADPNQNSDTTANAFNGKGGAVNVSALAIFGLLPRSRAELQALLGTDQPEELNPAKLITNDITAISQQNPTLSGQVNISTPNVDPARGLTELPVDIVDAAGLIAQNLCTVAGKDSAFVVTGRGGLPPSPQETLNADATWEDWRVAGEQGTTEVRSSHLEQRNQVESVEILEAQGLVKAADGTVMLTSAHAESTPTDSWFQPLNCQPNMNN